MLFYWNEMDVYHTPKQVYSFSDKTVSFFEHIAMCIKYTILGETERSIPYYTEKELWGIYNRILSKTGIKDV